MMYIAITGLRLNSALHTPRFWWHAARAMKQAQGANAMPFLPISEAVVPFTAPSDQ